MDLDIIEAGEIEKYDNFSDGEENQGLPWQDVVEIQLGCDDKAPTCSSISTCVSNAPPTFCIGLDTSKAGMEGLDKDRIDQVITQASMGSKFYKNEIRKDKELAIRLERMKKDLETVTPAQRQASAKAAEAEIASLESARDLGHIIVHLDMDAFYAAVEMRDNPALRDVPMAVGGMGMLSTSNYLARRFGVRAAMPGFIGKKLCPQLVIVKPNYDKYRAVSEQVRQILEEYDPDFCPVGLDESYLDLTSYVTAKMMAQGDTSVVVTSDGASSGQKDTVAHLTIPAGCERHSDTHLPALATHENHLSAHTVPLSMQENYLGANQAPLSILGNYSGAICAPPPSVTQDCDLTPLPASSDVTDSLPQLPHTFWECAQAVVKEIRERVYQTTGLTASAGIAANKMVAKIASDKNKPNGQCFVEPTRDGILQFIWQLPIRKISGIGKVTEKTLASLGITTCKQLYEKRGILPIAFSKSSCNFFFRVSLGISSFSVNREHQRKSMSTERTFPVSCDPTLLQEKCLNLCQALIKDIQDEGLRGKTVTLKLKTDQFEVKSRAVTLQSPVSSLEQLYQAASKLLATEMATSHPKPLSLRLMGVRVSSFESSAASSPQGTLDRLFQAGAAKPEPNSDSTHAKHDSKVLETGPPCMEHPGGYFKEAGPPCYEHQSGGKNSNPEHTEDAAGGTSPSLSHSSVVDDRGGRTMLECPVCGKAVTTDNKALNRHIDECLNTSTIHTLGGSGWGGACHRAETPVSRTCAGKRKSSEKTCPPAKKLAMSHTLDHFWNAI